MIVKIKNGEVELKEFCSRKLRKEINSVLYGDVKLINGENGMNYDGFTMGSMDKANDIALVGMTEKIIIDGQEKPVKIDTFDEMSDKDVENIITEINKFTNKEIPND